MNHILEALEKLDERYDGQKGTAAAKRSGEKRKNNEREEMTNPRKWKVGMRVVGLRRDSKSHGTEGELIKIEVTKNPSNYGGGTYRNPSYTIRTDDGKELKFQGIKNVEKEKK